MSNIAPVILALDVSSTNLGYVVYSSSVLAQGEHRLGNGEIAARCQEAHAIVAQLLDQHVAIDCIAIESPVGRYIKALIPQARVSGAILALAALRFKHVIEVSPSAAKLALSGTGIANKQLMQEKAKAFGVTGEHASDALGVALAAMKRVDLVLA